MGPKSILKLTTALAFSGALEGLVSAGTIQLPGLTVPASAKTNAHHVREIFKRSYKAYHKYAFGHDDLAPLSESFYDGRNGWGASLVDAMSTMYIMGDFDKEFEEAVEFASKIDFSKSKTPDNVSVFETTIRYVGGFLSAYELSGKKYPVLVDKAKEVTDKLLYSYTGSVGFNFGWVNFTDNKPSRTSSNIAEAGTLTLEWATLSKYTGNSTYQELAEGNVKHILSLTPPLPGLPAQGIWPNNGTFNGAYVTWGGGSDSYLEYLIKLPRLTNTDDAAYVDAWKLAVDSSIKYLLTTSTIGNWTYLADYTDAKRVRNIGSHLACFHGGNWIMGGRLLDNQTIVDIGLKLTDACWNTYASTATGIGPEVFAWISPSSNYSGATPSAADLSFYNKNGFYIYSPGYAYYDLRPEVLESNFYAWRATGDTKYLDRAEAAYKAFNEYVKVGVAYAGRVNVNNATDDTYFDDTESFWYAEVLKYLYLTFDDPSHISLDEWVFNTEAHPLQAPPAKDSYRTSTVIKQKDVPFDFKAQTAEQPVVSFNPRLPGNLKQLTELYEDF